MLRAGGVGIDLGRATAAPVAAQDSNLNILELSPLPRGMRKESQAPAQLLRVENLGEARDFEIVGTNLVRHVVSSSRIRKRSSSIPRMTAVGQAHAWRRPS